jgi:subtilisin family serine protease
MLGRLRALAALLLVAGGAALAAAPAGAGPRIVVAFDNPAPLAPPPAGSSGSRYGGAAYLSGQGAREAARRLARTFGLRELDSWPIQVLSMHCVVFEIPDGRSPESVLAAVSADHSVKLAQRLNEFHTLTDATGAAAQAYNDPLYDLQTNLATLGIARAHRQAQGEGVRVALIDTAVDVRHPDLAGRILRTQSFLTEPTAAERAQRHGTAMAGVIAAVANNHIGIVGIAPRARLEVFEACWQLAPDADEAACNTFTLARALAAALSSGAPLVNLSLAGPADPLLGALVQVGLRRGIVFVAAAASASAPFPSAIEGVITASASEEPRAPATLAAPAQHVLTLRPHAEYDFASGSSIAAAEVTGVIALLLSASPARLDPATLRALLAPATPIDVNGALTRLAARSERGSSYAARAAALD